MGQNVDKVTAYVLDNAKTLTAAKIKAMAEVIKALGSEREHEPNQVSAQNDPNLIDEEQPVDLSKVANIVVDGKKQPIKIYSN